MNSVYKIVRTLEEVEELIGYCLETRYCCFDFETSSLKYYEDSEYPTCLGISFQVGSAWVIPLGHFESPFHKIYPKILKKVGKALIENPHIIKIGWNLKYEFKWFKKYGIEIRGRCFDAMLAKYPLDETQPFGLKKMVDRFLPDFSGYELPGSQGKNFNWARVPLKELTKYCGIDCDASFRMFLYFEKLLMDLGFYTLYRNMFCMLVKVLGKAEFDGVPINREYLESLIIKYGKLLEDNDKEIRDRREVRKYERITLKERKQAYLDHLADKAITPLQITNMNSRIRAINSGVYSNKDERAIFEPMNFASAPQMARFLYTHPKGLKLPIIERTEKGEPSSGEETLLKLQLKYKVPFIDHLLKFRELAKLDSTYISGMLNHLSSEGRVHCNYKIMGTVTGRLSSTEPNMQNIPRMCISRDQIIITKGGLRRIGDFIPRGYGVTPLKGLRVKTHTGKWRKVLYGVNKGREEMYEVELENGEKITCTLGHKLLTPNGWESLAEIIKNNSTLLCYGY